MRTFYIVTPVLNSASFLDTAVSNIVNQAGDFVLHYHIQDGGSTDGTLDKIKQWEELLSRPNPIAQCARLHFTWASEPDTGIYNALNKAFAKLDIPDDAIMGWCNADDVYLPHVFACLTKIFADAPEVKYLCGRWRFWENNTLYDHAMKGPYPQEVMRQFCCDGRMWSPLPQPSVFWKGALWHKAGPLDDTLKYAADFELWRRFALHAECVYFPLVISQCARHESQLAKQRPQASGSPTYYELEKEALCPLAKRIQVMRKFWHCRILPPYASILLCRNGSFYVKKIHTWPAFWGETLIAYFARRLFYYLRQMGLDIPFLLKKLKSDR